MTKDELIYYAEINKYCTYMPFYTWIAERSDYEIFVEVGTWKGQGVVHLAQQLLENRDKDNFKIYAIDLFEDLWKFGNYEKLYEGFKIKHIAKMFDYNLKSNKIDKYVTRIKEYSHKAADQFEDGSVDFVFIDADHEFENVKKDIYAWLPKVKKGGIIAGHDYVASQQGVIKAVNSIWRKDRKFYAGHVWYKEIK